MKMSPQERFDLKVNKAPGLGPNGECWEWTARLDHKGYGRFRLDGRMGLAHRASFQLANGSIDSSKLIMHSCDNRRCVNPAHLSQGTALDNVQDMIDKGRAWHSNEKTHCKRGHEFTPENTRYVKAGRNCRACGRMLKKKYKSLSK